PGPVFAAGRTLDIVVRITNTGNVPLVLGPLDTGALGAVDCGATAQLLPGESVECTTQQTPHPGNYVFPLAMTLGGPDASGTDGAPAAAAASTSGTLFFQVLEPGVLP